MLVTFEALSSNLFHDREEYYESNTSGLKARKLILGRSDWRLEDHKSHHGNPLSRRDLREVYGGTLKW